MKNHFSLLTKARVIIVILLTSFFLLGSCVCGKKKTDENQKDTTTVLPSDETSTKSRNDTEGITLISISESADFSNAELEIAETKIKNDAGDSVDLVIFYRLLNFSLTKNTEDEKSASMANSHEGQHIHSILDNEPYQALYAPENSLRLKKGSEHYLLSFISRSYHQSIKHSKAAVLKHFKITKQGEYEELPLATTPLLFYSRPKGEYTGDDVESILLDFYLFNVDLEKEGYTIKAEINGNEFLIDTWQSYTIQGLPIGEASITLSLIDKDGKVLEGDYTTISRKIMLSDSE